MITYDDFAKLEIRIGTILSAEIVEGADKLLRLSVDVGEADEDGEKKLRQIISGIREFFPDPAVFVGRHCALVNHKANRVIRGI